MTTERALNYLDKLRSRLNRLVKYSAEWASQQSVFARVWNLLLRRGVSWVVLFKLDYK
jgi:hypothetical protein